MHLPILGRYIFKIPPTFSSTMSFYEAGLKLKKSESFPIVSGQKDEQWEDE